MNLINDDVFHFFNLQALLDYHFKCWMKVPIIIYYIFPHFLNFFSDFGDIWILVISMACEILYKLKLFGKVEIYWSPEAT